MKMWWVSLATLAGALVVGCHEGAGDVDVTAGSGGSDAIGVQDTGGTPPGSCTAAHECADFYDGCKVTSCVDGKCESEAKATGAFCTAPSLIPAECETTRCDSAGLCAIAPVADGSACGPDDACTLGTCAAGACTGKVVPADCDDGNTCTIDGCGPGGCTNTPSTAACDDGDGCTSGDSCATGTCVGTPSCDCTSDADCEEADEDPCDGTSKCTGGKCVNDPKTAVVCPEPVTAGPCEAPVCNPSTGACSLQIVVGQECSDGIACTTGDACTAAGECESQAIVCEFNCTDEVDDDSDGQTNCNDSDCANDSACAVPPECVTATDCTPIPNVCITRTCDEGICGELDVADGTPVPDQAPGDCQLVVCDGDGGTRSTDDATDLPTPKTVCQTAPACTGTPLAPSFTAEAAGTNCAADGVMGKALCGDGDAEGTCVACNSAADCPATGNECIAPTCADHVCGTENLGETVTATDGQEPGDCQKLVCNGAGGTTSVDDPADLPTSTTVCRTNPACEGVPLAPSFTPAPVGTDCSADGVSGASFCGEGLMAGVCGECNAPTDCPSTGNECIAATCIDNECGTENLGETTTLTGGQEPGDCQKLVCNGGGDSKSIDDALDLPVATTACLVNPACEGAPLAPAFTPATTGESCVADGLLGKTVCGDTGSVFAGTCVQCTSDAHCPGGTCDEALATCIADPTCSDNMKNGLEVGVDCGGTCPGCPADTACTADIDCASDMCYENKCVTTLNGCKITTATDQTAIVFAAVSFPNGNLTYSPKCIKVKLGTMVRFAGSFVGHPMIGGVVAGTVATPATSGPFVPVSNIGTAKDFTMSTLGEFPYYCQPHGTLGMNGVVFVVP